MEVVMEQQMMQRMFSMYVKLDAKIYIYVDNVWMLVDMRNMYDIDSYARGKLWWNDIINCNSMQSDMKQMDIKALSGFQIIMDNS